MKPKQKAGTAFRALDILYLALMILPLVAGMLIASYDKPFSGAISITGARILWRSSEPVLFDYIQISEAQVNSWLVMISITGLCLYLTHGLTERADSVRQHVAEWCVEKCEKLVRENMGEFFLNYAPFIASILALSAFSSLTSLLGMFAPTSDINVCAGWAILVFAVITAAKFRCGPLMYVRSFTEPVPAIAILNVISEVATPLSMSFRHYGNVMSGAVISVLISAALSKLSQLLLGWLPGVLGTVPFLRIGLPAVLSVYFDIFSGCLQAYIFAMLTMLYVSGGFPMDEYLKRQANKQKKIASQAV